MYVSYGLEPNNFKYDAKSTKGASKESITIDNAKKGNYYVMIFSKQGNGNFTLTASSGPAPSAVVITSKENLKTKYGQEGFDKIEQRIKDYMKAVIDGGIKANLIYVDDANCLSPFNLRPVDPNNAGKIKDLIDSLDKSLSHRYFTIIGGHTVIPFHIVPNPALDQDKSIYTDNPYASQDADILLPGRALGRLPDDNSNAPTFLIQLLETVTSRIKKARSSSFGCSAQVFAYAADNVFDSVRYGEQLNVSPPVLSSNLDPPSIQHRKFMYFDLHGNEDTKYWFGQGNQDNSEDPIAFSPDNLEGANVENAIVYSEACYGANIVDKSVDDAICLKFLQKKAACFVGSTKIVYGAYKPPISEADILGLKFLERIKEGLAFGDAFLMARRDYAREAIANSNTLTPKDMKTLLEYVLYADPLLKVMEA